VQGYWYHF